jgi:hypothetical protein
MKKSCITDGSLTVSNSLNSNTTIGNTVTTDYNYNLPANICVTWPYYQTYISNSKAEIEMSYQLRYTITVNILCIEGKEWYKYIGYPSKCRVDSDFCIIHEIVDGEDSWHYFPIDSVESIHMVPIIS